MRILMIGNENLMNDGIKTNLVSEEGFEVHHIAPQHISRHDFESPKKKFNLTLIDLTSFPGRSISCVKRIARKEPSDYLVALHTASSDSSIQKFIDSGANRCLPVNTDTDKLIEVVSQFKDSIRF